MKGNIMLPVSAWERAISRRPDIEFEEVTFQGGLVTGVTGYIRVRGIRRPASWRSDGHCYYKGNRARSYDIRF